MSPRDQHIALDQARMLSSDCNSYLESAGGVLEMADGGTQPDAAHAMHCAELIIDLVRNRLDEVEKILCPVIEHLGDRAE